MPLVDATGRPVTGDIGPAASAGAGQGAEGNGAASPHAKDSDLAHFAADVLEASREVPVIVDFWAPWCGPCRQLGPALERVVAQAKGTVRLIKINIDENPEIAQQLRIQSVPTVYAFRNGQPVDGFMGAISEAQLRTFVSGLTGGAAEAPTADALADATEAMAAGDVSLAAQIYAQLLQEEPGHPKAAAGLAQCYLASGDLERARTTLGLARPDGAQDEAVRAVAAELALKENASKAGDILPWKARLNADPGDHEARFALALALDASGDREGAVEELLELIRRERDWNDQAARKQLLTIFEAMGPTDSRTVSGRRRLSSLLFS